MEVGGGDAGLGHESKHLLAHDDVASFIFVHSRFQYSPAQAWEIQFTHINNDTEQWSNGVSHVSTGTY